MKKYIGKCLARTAAQIRELKLETIFIFAVIPYSSFGMFLNFAHRVTVMAFRDESAQMFEAAQENVYFAAVFQSASIVPAAIVAWSQLRIIWEGSSSEDPFLINLARSFGLLLVYAPMVLILLWTT